MKIIILQFKNRRKTIRNYWYSVSIAQHSLLLHDRSDSDINMSHDFLYWKYVTQGLKTHHMAFTFSHSTIRLLQNTLHRIKLSFFQLRPNSFHKNNHNKWENWTKCFRMLMSSKFVTTITWLSWNLLGSKGIYSVSDKNYIKIGLPLYKLR